MNKLKLAEILSVVMKQKRNTDNYADGVLDMYNAIAKELES